MEAWKLGYEKAKNKAKNIYSKIGRVPCPALNGDLVAFNSKGFNHLIRKGRKQRPKNVQKKRFVLVPYLENIIRNPNANISFKIEENVKHEENRYGEKVLITSRAYFWAFFETIEDCKVRLVVRQLGDDGEKHFFSVMGDNVKISHWPKKKSKKKQKTAN